MRLNEVLHELEAIAPTRYAEPWDNVGLLVGDSEQSVSAAMLCIDYTPDVAREAQDHRCDFIIAYHPPIFSAIKRVTGPSLVFDAIRRGVAIYSPHTALDAADGGTNDMLADAMGMTDRQPLRVREPKATQFKFITFVPERHLEQVATNLFDAGAGRIGEYSQCSFQSPGTGTFFGGEGTNPATGESGKLERAAEIRLETIVPIARLSAVIGALRKSHPYEEPAFDLVQLAAPPETVGQGRVGSLPNIERGELFERIKKELGLTHLLISGPSVGPAARAACCAGSGGEFLDDAIAATADLYLSGEIRHHDALKAAKAGMTVVCTLHSNSERAVLKRMMTRLTDKLPGFAVRLSEKDRDPFAVR